MEKFKKILDNLLITIMSFTWTLVMFLLPVTVALALIKWLISLF